MTTFNELGLPDALVDALVADGISEPFPIQIATIPPALAGSDLLGRARTGSGKTLAFGLPMIVRAADGPRARRSRPTALVLTPTRELAHQVRDALRPYARVLGLKVGSVVGGEAYRSQIDLLDRGVDILVATPGRLTDLVDQQICILDEVRTVVLDEADQMADVGFLPEVCDLLDMVPSDGMRMLFSATLDSRVQDVVERYLTDPIHHGVDEADASVPDMEHHVLAVRPADKRRMTAVIAARPGRTVLFVRSRLGAERTAEQLDELGIGVAALHGGMSQAARSRTMEKFRDGSRPVLVATDVAARGIHVDDIDLVLHVDPPADPRDYLHRAGRTARAGRSGAVVTLALPHQVRPILGMLNSVGVSLTPVSGAPDSPEIAELTGARDPQVAAAEHREAEELRRAAEAAARRNRPASAQRGRGPRREGGGRYGRSDNRTGGRTWDAPRDERPWSERDAEKDLAARGERPTGARSTGGRPTGGRPTGGHPTNERPSYDRPRGTGGAPREGDRRPVRRG